jgi:hypothetical protein
MSFSSLPCGINLHRHNNMMVDNNSPTSTSMIANPDKLDIMKGENLITTDNIASSLVSLTSQRTSLTNRDNSTSSLVSSTSQFVTPNYVASSQYPEASLAVRKGKNHLYKDFARSTINQITSSESLPAFNHCIIQSSSASSLLRNSSNDAPSLLSNSGSDIANDIFLMNETLNLLPNDGSTSVSSLSSVTSRCFRHVPLP